MKQLSPSQRDSLVEAVDHHLDMGHRLVGKRPGPYKGSLPKEWQQHEGHDRATLVDGIETGAFDAVMWVLDATDLVVDVDRHEGKPDGRKAMQQLVKNDLLPETYVVMSGGATPGFHYVYKKDPGAKVRNKLTEFPGIDFLSKGRFVLIEGSKHPVSGGIYRLADNSDRRVVRAPGKLERLITRQDVVEHQATGLDRICSRDDIKNLFQYMEDSLPPEDNPTWFSLVQAAANIAVRYLGVDQDAVIVAVQEKVHQWSAKDEGQYDPAAAARIDQVFNHTADAGVAPEALGFKTWVEHALAPKAAEGKVKLKPALIQPVTALAASDIPEPEYHFRPFMKTASLNIIHAQTGVGKSWVSMDLLRSLVTGERWMGIYENLTPLTGKCLYVDGEMPMYDLASRWRKLIAGTERPEALERVDLFSIVEYTLQQESLFDLSTPGARESLTDLIATRKYQHVVLDNKSALVLGGAENDNNAEVAQFLSWLMRLRGMGVGVTFIMHEGKTAGTHRGGSRWIDTSDMALSLVEDTTETGLDYFQLKFVKTRGHKLPPGERSPKVRLVDCDDGIYLTELKEGEIPHAKELELLRLADKYPDLSSRELAEHASYSQSTLSRHRKSCILKGWIEDREGQHLTQLGRGAIPPESMDDV